MYPILPYDKRFRNFNKIAVKNTEINEYEHFTFGFKQYDVIFNPTRVSTQIRKYDLKKMMERLIGSTTAPLSGYHTT